MSDGTLRGVHDGMEAVGGEISGEVDDGEGFVDSLAGVGSDLRVSAEPARAP